MAGPALAQQAAADAPAADTAAAAADHATLDDVVVTANKRAENIREVAVVDHRDRRSSSSRTSTPPS